MEPFLHTLALLVIGMGLRKVPQFPRETAQALNLFVIYVSLPALVLLKVPSLRFSSDLLVPVLMPWAMLTISVAITLWASRLLRLDRKTTGLLLLVVPLGNTSFLGIPMVTAFLGESGVPYALLYDQFGSFLALSTYGSAIVAFYGGDGRLKPREITKRIFTFPPFISLAVALLLVSFPDPYPNAFRSLLALLSATLVPVVMIAVGFQLSPQPAPGHIRPLAAGLAIKLVAAPLIALISCRILGLEGLAAQVSILEAGMPPMVSAAAIAAMAGLSPELSAALVGFGILLSFVTLPMLVQLFLNP